MLVQKNLPKVAYELFKKNDVNYKKILAIEVKNFKNVLVDIINRATNGEVTIDKMKSFSSDEFLNLLVQQEGNSFDLKLFFVQLKLNEITISYDTRNEISLGWELIEEKKHVQIEAKKEIEKVKHLQEKMAKEQMKVQRVRYDAEISELQQMQQKLEADINVKQQSIFLIETESKEKDSLIQELKVKLDKQKKEKEIVLQKKEVLSQEVKKLEIKIHDKMNEIQKEWKKQWEIENQSLIKRNDELNDEIKRMNKEITDKQKEYEVLQLSLEVTKTTIEEYMVSVQSKMNNMQQNNVVEYREQDESVKYDISTTFDTLLSAESGYINIDAHKCENYQEFQDIVEENLKIVGCKRRDDMLQDEISAAINTGLIPLICGFGARKVAIAYMAARFGEIASIISMPSGFGNTRELECAINNCCTKSVIIEDLFGRMSENVILPILRKDIGKQIIFCCEDVSELKYVEKYYFNYIYVVKIDKVYNGNILDVVYSDATEYFSKITYNKTEGHKVVRLLLNQMDIADSYIISRGDLISYMTQEMHHAINEVLKKWFKDELKIVLNETHRKNVIEIIEANQIKFCADLAESIQYD